MMPEMNGIEFLRAAHEIDPDLVGIVMTGHGAIETAVAAMKTGALDYILKPFKLSAILPVLSRSVAVRRLRMMNLALTKGVADRTAELEAKNRELSAANKDLEAFAYSASHDLRSPLRTMEGFLRIVLDDYAHELSAEVRTHIERTASGAQRLSLLIEALLKFSHLGRQPLAKQTVNMKALAHEALRELEVGEAASNAIVRIGDLPDCAVDGVLFKQVLVNLLSNAFKFTRHEANALIELDGRREGGECVYEVRDNGVGFDPRYAQKLFGIFQRLHRHDEFEGTGVGLSIVQRIVERHGGRIAARSEIGQGATFTLRMPG
jgi:light-regulated signal transduction histidine kinase (bacteriophytochrome)